MWTVIFLFTDCAQKMGPGCPEFRPWVGSGISNFFHTKNRPLFFSSASKALSTFLHSLSVYVTVFSKGFPFLFGALYPWMSESMKLHLYPVPVGTPYQSVPRTSRCPVPVGTPYQSVPRTSRCPVPVGTPYQSVPRTSRYPVPVGTQYQSVPRTSWMSLFIGFAMTVDYVYEKKPESIVTFVNRKRLGCDRRLCYPEYRW